MNECKYLYEIAYSCEHTLWERLDAPLSREEYYARVAGKCPACRLKGYPPPKTAREEPANLSAISRVQARYESLRDYAPYPEQIAAIRAELEKEKAKGSDR